MTTPTILPVVTPQQQMALAFRDFSLPEGTEVEVILDTGSFPLVTAKRTKVWSIRADGNWVEAIGRDQVDAVARLVREVARP